MTNWRIPYNHCPLCEGRGEFLRMSECRDHPLYRTPLPDQIAWHRCVACGHVFTDGYFSENALSVLFSGAQLSQTVGQNMESDRYIWSETVNTVSSIRQSYLGRWLDVGFGSGNLLLTAAEYGYEVTGTDLRKSNVDAFLEWGYMAHCLDVLDLEADHQFDVISMADVLEHMPFPKLALKHVHELLSSTGVLFLSMPNTDSPLWGILDRGGVNPYWGELEHYHNFGRNRLYQLLNETGFEVQRYGVSKRYRIGMEIISTAKFD